ncbi:MAG: aminoacyl-tRNA hydrolase [Patescibacteria group bacterium]|nr:aminoacyl-tRNA hydrolase [Patescibacteria group bacterium]MDE2438369.1 aminoacyl-tRNA hydrolase [Patescibacteria group bacterium]
MEPFLVVGLGNAEKRYEHTYHNVGFLALDRLAARFSLEPTPLTLPIRWSLKKITAIMYTLTDESRGAHYMFAKPQCYMNESGITVAALMRRYADQYHLTSKGLYVIHDDSDIALGSYKLKWGGNSGGHNGIESVIRFLGTQEFWHLKIGIRNMMDPIRVKAEKLVLQHIGSQEQHALDTTISEALDSLEEQCGLSSRKS